MKVHLNKLIKYFDKIAYEKEVLLYTGTNTDALNYMLKDQYIGAKSHAFQDRYITYLTPNFSLAAMYAIGKDAPEEIVSYFSKNLNIIPVIIGISFEKNKDLSKLKLDTIDRPYNDDNNPLSPVYQFYSDLLELLLDLETNLKKFFDIKTAKEIIEYLKNDIDLYNYKKGVGRNPIKDGIFEESDDYGEISSKYSLLDYLQYFFKLKFNLFSFFKKAILNRENGKIILKNLYYNFSNKKYKMLFIDQNGNIKASFDFFSLYDQFKTLKKIDLKRIKKVYIPKDYINTATDNFKIIKSKLKLIPGYDAMDEITPILNNFFHLDNFNQQIDIVNNFNDILKINYNDKSEYLKYIDLSIVSQQLDSFVFELKNIENITHGQLDEYRIKMFKILNKDFNHQYTNIDVEWVELNLNEYKSIYKYIEIPQ